MKESAASRLSWTTRLVWDGIALLTYLLMFQLKTLHFKSIFIGTNNLQIGLHAVLESPNAIKILARTLGSTNRKVWWSNVVWYGMVLLLVESRR